MSQWQVVVRVKAAYVDELSDYLFDLGALSVTLTDAGDTPIYEPSPLDEPLWEENYLMALFECQQEAESILIALANQYPNIAADCRLEEIVEQAWERTCLDQFQPMQFGERLWICPSWLTPPDPKAINIVLDPGLAFGTGTHPTTALCLEWLDANPPRNQTVLDYGCGSGILAIAALKLEAACVWAVDIHEQALLATKDNAHQNQISATQLCVSSPNNLPTLMVDLLIANILALPLIELAPTLSAMVKPQGKIVLSGILESQINAILSAYQPFMIIDSIKTKEEWVRIVGTRLN